MAPRKKYESLYAQAVELQDPELVNCIYRGTILLIGFIAVLVALSTYVPSVNAWSATPGVLIAGAAFVGLALLVGSLRLIALVLSVGRLDSYAAHSFEFSLWFVGYSLLLMTLATYASKHVVLTAVVTSAALLALAQTVGATSWGKRLLGTIVLVGVMWSLNYFVFDSSTVEIIVSIFGVLIFNLWAVFDVNTSFCEYEGRCCSAGVMSVWSNIPWFANRLWYIRHLFPFIEE